MTKLSLIRLASYVVCAAAFVLLKKTEPVESVSFAAPEEIASIDDRRAAKRESLTVVAHKDFRLTRLSGSEVVALAMMAAQLDARYLDDRKTPHWGQPHSSLRQEAQRMVWDVTFWRVASYYWGILHCIH